MERRAIAVDRRFQGKIAARAENGCAMVAKKAVNENDVAWLHATAPRVEGRRRIAPIPVVVIKILSQAPLFTTLVSPVTMVTPASRAVSRHRAAIRRKRSTGDPLFDDDRAGQVERRGAADREIVDGAADGELADVAAGENQRIDDERIGGERETIAALRQGGQIEPRLVVERRQQRIVEGLDEYIVDEVLHRLAAAAMGERHRRHMHSAARALAMNGTTFMPRPPRPAIGPAAFHAAILIIGGAGAFRRHHQRAKRRLRRARRAEHLALPRLDHALEHLAALAGFRIGDLHVRHCEFRSASKRAYAARILTPEWSIEPRPRHSKNSRNS